jgi:uncharacterized repeat protein (TIGR01451 family)
VFLSGSLLSMTAQSAPTVSAQEGGPTATSLQSIDPGQSQVVPTTEANQGLIHIVPMGKAPTAIKQTSAPAGAHLTYWGGPVIPNIHVVAVFWGTHVNPTITGTGGTTSIAQFFTDITQSRYIDLLSEYSTIGINGAGSPVTSSNQTIGRGQFDGAFTIAPSLCPGTTACSLTDSQIAAELAAQINASHLPQPVSDAQGNVSSFYMIYFPAGVSISLDAVTHSCVQFCAYHSNTSADLTPKLVPYGVQPDFAPPSGCATGCGDNAALFDNVTEVTSHEMFEAITDPLVGSATTLASPLAWFDPGPDPANPLGEIGDICLGQRASVPAGNTTYVVQREFSNLQADCVSAPPIFTLTAPPEGAGPSLPVNVTLAVQNSANNFPLATYSGTVHFTSSDPLAVLPPDASMAGSDVGTRVFSVTFKTLGDQTITATDTHSPGFNGTGTVNVNTTPDLTVAKTHAPAHFFIGETGATYSIVVTNSGHGTTSGTVTATDNLPSGLTATAIGGTGWSCTLGTLTCTRADSLAAIASYPAITVTVNVALNAPSPVTNTATVSGGGEANATNDTASEFTLVDAPDLDVTKSHFGPINGNFFQGETGATYNISVANRGVLPTNGTVTLVDTLPVGMTATAISGTGWSCTLATLTCTRSDTLAPTLAYPTITLTVNVALDAPASTVNIATISGGGEVNTANDLTQDLTLIVPPPVPDLAIRKSHFGSFAPGGTGTYSIDVQNIGTAPTNGTITVTDTLPAGLTANSISGVAWNCTLATLTCTRSSSLQVSAPAETITVNVNVAPDAPSSVINTATVAGGGDTNLANNTANDPTSIVVPVVDLTPLMVGTTIATQGNTNTSYTITIHNTGNLASSGTVSAVVTLSTGLTAVGLVSTTGWSCTLSTLTCTRSDSLASGSSFPDIIAFVNFANDAPATGKVSVAVSGGGDSNAANNTASKSITISPLLGINVTGDSASVNAGTPAQFTFSVSPAPSAGVAAFNCSGLPAASACSFNPPAAIPGGNTPVTMTISTTARSVAILDVPGGRRPYSPLLPVLGLLAATAGAISLHRVAQAKRLRWAFGLMTLLLLAALFGCGGGGSGAVVQNPPGTPAGTYSITVNAVTPNATKSFVVMLQVK